jgi:hypothetical protein
MLKKVLVYMAGISSLFAASGRVLSLDDFENAASLRNWKGDIRLRADRASHGRSSAQVRFTERQATSVFPESQRIARLRSPAL